MKKGIANLLEIMTRLRDKKNGCPWDIEQTFETIIPFTIEEVYEVADAIDRKDMDGLLDELGDLLFQVVFLSHIASENGLFSFFDVVDVISEKMVRRHPHVFSNERIMNIDEQAVEWEKIKSFERMEKEGKELSATDDSSVANVLTNLPSLVRAQKLQNKASKVGFDWRHANDVIEKVFEEIDEITFELENNAETSRLEDEIGDLLFTVTNLARKLQIDADTAMRKANTKFEKRFRIMEHRVKSDNLDMELLGPQDLDSYWLTAKRLFEKHNDQ